MRSNPLHIIILAAGHGTRMKSDLPKVLHPLADKPLLSHVVHAAAALNPAKIHVICGYQAERVKTVCKDLPVNWVTQAEQLGTAHAVQQALPFIEKDARVLVLCGDNPLISTVTLQALIKPLTDNDLGLLTAVLEDPRKLGRIVRDSQNKVERIVEFKDATDAERKIPEINSGIMSFSMGFLEKSLKQVSNNNAQQEYYLTDLISIAVKEGVQVKAYQTPFPIEVSGVNDKQELAMLEREHQLKQAKALMEQGVLLRDPTRLDIRGEVSVAQDVEIDVNVILEGKVTLGKGCRIGANCILKNVSVGEGTEILPNSVLEDCEIGNDCRVGPFARLRPGTVLKQGAKIGNFVETKKSTIGKNSKVSHLSYIGDTTMGDNVNVGAGTITCNYDGVNKHKTVIENGVFIGSNTALVAPVTLHQGATTGAGSTITTDIPAKTLAVSRAKQKHIESWKRPEKA